MAPDVADEFDALFTIDEEALPEFEPLFDPTAYAEKNPEPKIGVAARRRQTAGTRHKCQRHQEED